MRYYDLKWHWTKRIEPHLGDEKLNAILVRDFNKFTQGNWRTPFKRTVPSRFRELRLGLGTSRSGAAILALRQALSMPLAGQLQSPARSTRRTRQAVADRDEREALHRVGRKGNAL